MTNLPGNEPRFFFSDRRFEVLGFQGSERLSQLYGYELELVSDQPEIELAELIGQPASLTILGWDRAPRYLHGLITRLEITSVHKQRTVYEAILEPPHVKLTLRHKLRVFQDLTTQEIVEQVLQEGGVTKLEWRLQESYKPRNFCVQYRESDMAFVRRLLQEEGITLFFEHSQTELKTVFCDHNAGFAPIPAGAGPQHAGSTLIYNPSATLVADRESVLAFAYGEQLCSGKVQLRDYSFKRPRQLPKGNAAGQQRALEVYDYPGEFVDQELGRRLANVRLEAAESGRTTGSGQSDCPRLLPGHRFTLGGKRGGRHPLEQLNQEYLLVEVTHSGEQGWALGEEGPQSGTRYSNGFEVVPARTRYRPGELLERPAVLGTYTATVLGPPGEPIYVDNYGRVKIRFHWDRERKSTAWVRVAQSWAGAGFGGQLLPRVGQEVLVGFLEGDPDRPLVIGRVYNGEHRVPYELPQHETRSTLRSNSIPPQAGDTGDQSSGLVDPLFASSGSNELRFEDQQGAEEVYLHAEKDYQLVVENDRTTEIGHDRAEEIGRDQTLIVESCEELLVNGKAVHTAKTTLLEGAEALTLQVGSSRLLVTPEGVELKSARVVWNGKIVDLRGGALKINCGQPLPPEPPAKLSPLPSPTASTGSAKAR